ncbi:MAG TPA: twin-arginine translocase subunit TatC [Solirubrobacteraceae bacterium]|nr:twin-arginine translocase subunit TatC [Solirubrobacteraceae bacterium]
MPPTGLRPIGHEDKLTLVDHLTELRKRLLISAFTLVAAFSFCFWQNNAILDIVTKPVRETQNLQNPSSASQDPLEQSARFQIETGQAFKVLAPALGSASRTFKALQDDENLTAAQRSTITSSAAQLAAASRQFAQAAAARPTNTQRNLVTLGVTEPFTATITIAFYASLLLALPMLLFQAYAFILPAFSPGERKLALPLMLMVPVLFIMGAAFGYFVVLTRAVEFLQNFNDDSFDILLQAKDYFKFAVLFVAGVGLLFQIPVGVLAVTRLGIFTPKQLAKNRGYVILGIAVLAAVATPTPDPFTMSLAMAPLIVLFELSILLARWIERIKPPSDGAGRWDDDFDDDDDEPDGDAPDDDDPGGRWDDPHDFDDEDEDEHAEPQGARSDLTKLGEPDRKD